MRIDDGKIRSVRGHSAQPHAPDLMPPRLVTLGCDESHQTLAHQNQRENETESPPLGTHILGKAEKEIDEDFIIHKDLLPRFTDRDPRLPETVEPRRPRSRLPRFHGEIKAVEALVLLPLAHRRHARLPGIQTPARRTARSGRPCHLILRSESRHGTDATRTPAPASSSGAAFLLRSHAAAAMNGRKDRYTSAVLDSLFQILRFESWQVLVELLVIWTCVFLVFRFLRGTRGAGVIRGFAVLLVIATVLIRFVGQGSDLFDRLSFIYERFLGFLAFVLIVVFQPELRQVMTRIGHGMRLPGSGTADKRAIEAVAEAAIFLSKSQFGALIAIERRTRLGELTEKGQPIDAIVSARLLESIFFPNSPLHDLGVVIRDDRIIAAGVQFPLAEEGVLDGSFGSRHRAGLGLATESDAVVVIVSEEQGTISIAENGHLEFDVPRDRIIPTLRDLLFGTRDNDASGGASGPRNHDREEAETAREGQAA